MKNIQNEGNVNALQELQERLKSIRQYRKRISTYEMTQLNNSFRQESETIREIERLQRDPPMGPAIIMMLTDVIKSYETRLKSVDSKLSANKLSSSIIITMFILQVITLAMLFMVIVL